MGVGGRMWRRKRSCEVVGCVRDGVWKRKNTEGWDNCRALQLDIERKR